MVNALKRRRGKNAALMLLSAVALAPQIVSAQNDYVIGETPTERNTPNPIRGLEPEPIPSPAPDMSDSSVSVTVEPQKFEPVAIPSLPADTRKSDSVIEDRILKTEEIDAMLSGSGYSTPNTYAPSSTHETVGSGIVYLNEPAEVCETLPLVNHQRFWARAEAIGMWVQGDQVPSLLTTSPDATALANAGVLGQDTTILFGNDRIGQEARLGGRVSLGRWLKHIDLVGVQAEVTYLQESRDTSTFTSAGLPILARPFQNVDPGVDAADASIVAFDGLSSGSVSIDTRSEVYSGNFGFRRVSIRHTDPHRGKYANWISGFRYFRLAESLRIDDNRVALGAFTDPFGNFNAADTFSSFDSFKTQNDFYGFEFGSNFGRSRGRWTFDALAKVAIGVNHQLIEIDGSTTFGGATVAGGLLTSGDVIGQHTRRRFTVLPEVRLQTGYHLTKHIEAKIGYQFLLVSDVVRPGSEIDQQANGTFLNAAVANTGPNRPAVAFDSDTIFMHGATAALEFKF